MTLEFGTGGIRAVMGPKEDQFNEETIKRATQGLANYILLQKVKNPSVFIGYDSRHHSRKFAEVASQVLAANDIKVYLFKELRPTPLVSFGCRYKRCTAAIMITASHNPPEYNGYKVYWSDGAQVVFPHDVGIVAEVAKIEASQVRLKSLSDPLIEEILEEVDEAYLQAISKLPLYPKEMRERGSELKMVYTSLHGTGITLVPRLLKEWGFCSLTFVEQQIIPDGNFTYAPSPNPEERSALELGIAKLKETNSDILIATDPDADRVGVAIMHQGEPLLINGNQMACLCLWHILKRQSQINTLPENAAFVKTIVTTELFQKICDAYESACFNVLTGFKYIAQKIREWEESSNPYQYLFGGEESYGYLWGTQTRDKDAVSSALLISEMALIAKLEGKTLYDLLHDLWKKFGLYDEKLLSLKFPETLEGRAQMAKKVEYLRTHPPTALASIQVEIFEDYDNQVRLNLKTREQTAIDLERANVLIFWLSDGSKVMVRPSGTEPKVKFYCSVTGPYEEGLEKLNQKADAILKDIT